MKAVVVGKQGDGLDAVAIGDVEKPEPGPGELRLRVQAVAINPVDWKVVINPFPQWSYPHVLGLDAAGVVDAIGPGVEGWAVGDRAVLHHNLLRQGVFAEYCIAPAHVTSRVPESVSFVSAAAVPCAGYTAYQALFRKAHLKAGQTVLVQGANGGVGGFALQMAHQAGARVIALAKPEHADALRRHGADLVFDYRDADLVEQVRAATADGQGVDIMLEVVNPGDARKSFAFIHYNGQLLSIDPLPDMSQVPSYTYAMSVHEVSLGGAYIAGHVATQRDFKVIGDAMMAMLAEGKLDPMVDEVITLADIPKALVRLKNRAVTGKIVADLTRI